MAEENNSPDSTNQVNDNTTRDSIIAFASSALVAVINAILSQSSLGSVIAIGIGLLLLVFFYRAWKDERVTANAVFISLVALVIIFLVATNLLQNFETSVSGQFVQAEGTPLTGVQITLLNSRGVEQKKITDQEGRFTIVDVPEGDFTLYLNGNSVVTNRVPGGLPRLISPNLDLGTLSRDPFDDDATATPTPTPLSPTETRIPSTATQVPTNTIVPPSATQMPTSTATSLPPTQTATPEPTDTEIPTEQPSDTPTAMPTDESDSLSPPFEGGTNIYEEDFEDGQVSNLHFNDTSWLINEEDTGNKYLQIGEVNSNQSTNIRYNPLMNRTRNLLIEFDFLIASSGQNRTGNITIHFANHTRGTGPCPGYSMTFFIHISDKKQFVSKRYQLWNRDKSVR